MTEAIKTKVLDYFHGDYNCAQSVLRTVLEERGISFPEASAIAANFGGGIIGRGEICGAVSGALMAIGVLAAHIESNVIEYKKLAREKAELFYENFEKYFGHNTCNGLIGIDPSDPTAKEKAREEGRYRDNCPNYVSQAVFIVLDLFSI